MENKVVEKQQKKWTKIPLRTQSMLIEMVFHQEYKIKQAAEIAGINYATAKHIIDRYRNKNIIKQMPNIPQYKRCSYKPISTAQPKYTILCVQGGKEIVKFKRRQ